MFHLLSLKLLIHLVEKPSSHLWCFATSMPIFGVVLWMGRRRREGGKGSGEGTLTLLPGESLPLCTGSHTFKLLNSTTFPLTTEGTDLLKKTHRCQTWTCSGVFRTGHCCDSSRHANKFQKICKGQTYNQDPEQSVGCISFVAFHFPLSTPFYSARQWVSL